MAAQLRYTALTVSAEVQPLAARGLPGLAWPVQCGGSRSRLLGGVLSQRPLAASQAEAECCYRGQRTNQCEDKCDNPMPWQRGDNFRDREFVGGPSPIPLGGLLG